MEIDGNFDDCIRLVREEAESESVYLVNSINPFRIEGQKTAALELMEQCNWSVPDHLVVPGGNLGNSTAMGKGFLELLELGLIERLPKLSVIQAEGAAPFAELFAHGEAARYATEPIPDDLLLPVAKPDTLATAIKIGAPVSWKKALRVVTQSGGHVISATEQEIADAKAIIGRDGVGCEPASAASVAGIRHLVAAGQIDPAERVVAVLTGHLLKDTEYAIKYHQGTLSPSTSKDRKCFAGAYSNRPVHMKASRREILETLDRHAGIQA